MDIYVINDVRQWTVHELDIAHNDIGMSSEMKTPEDMGTNEGY